MAENETKPAAAATPAPNSTAELREELIAAIGRYPEITDIAAACYSVPMISTPPCERYRDCLGQGKPMPPVLIDEDGYLLDGRHRVLAASRLGVPLEFEVTPRYECEIAYESLLARKHTGSQVAGFAANVIDAARNCSRYSRFREHVIHKVLSEVSKRQWTAGDACLALRCFQEKLTEAVADAFGIPDTLITQALRLTHQNRISVIDGRPLCFVLREQVAAEKAIIKDSSAPGYSDDDFDDASDWE